MKDDKVWEHSDKYLIFTMLFLISSRQVDGYLAIFGSVVGILFAVLTLLAMYTEYQIDKKCKQKGGE